MQLISDVMRKGAEGRSQFFGEYFDGPGKTGCCAMGAIILGLGLEFSKKSEMVYRIESTINHIYKTAEELVDPLKTILIWYNHANPDDGIDLHEKSLAEMIVYANDCAKLPIEEIADLVQAGEMAWMEKNACATA